MATGAPLTAKDLRGPLTDALRTLAAPFWTSRKAPRGRGGDRTARLALAEGQVKDLLGRTADPARAARLRAMLDRIATLRAKKPTAAAELNCELLQERKLQLTRRLTLQEQRVDFAALNERFNRLQAEIEAELEEATAEEISRATQNIKNKLDAGDIAGIAALSFLLRGRVREAINAIVKRSYETGKGMAAKEAGVPRGPTPLSDTQLMNLDAADIAERYASALEDAAKGAVKDGFAAGAATGAIVGAVRTRVSDEASRAILGVSGTVVGQYLNRGRTGVFFENISKIEKFQRSEVLDDATCNACLSLDERVVGPDDPFVRMDLVHTNCRGVWVPIFVSDPEIPKTTGIPKSVQDAFDTIDGRPTVNAFDQMKRARPVSTAARGEIARRVRGEE